MARIGPSIQLTTDEYQELLPWVYHTNSDNI